MLFSRQAFLSSQFLSMLIVLVPKVVSVCDSVQYQQELNLDASSVLGLLHSMILSTFKFISIISYKLFLTHLSTILHRVSEAEFHVSLSIRNSLAQKHCETVHSFLSVQNLKQERGTAFHTRSLLSLTAIGVFFPFLSFQHKHLALLVPVSFPGSLFPELLNLFPLIMRSNFVQG